MPAAAPLADSSWFPRHPAFGRVTTAMTDRNGSASRSPQLAQESVILIQQTGRHGWPTLSETGEIMENATPGKSRAPGALGWIFLLGGIGFAAGFFGPIILNPEANQGPLIGIFLSGPGGAILGLLLFIVCSVTHVSAARQWQTLAVVGVLGAGVTLAFALPGPAFRGYIVEVQLQGCKAPADLADESVDYWEKRVAKVTWAPPRAGWQQEARRQLQLDTGAVLDVTILRRILLYEGRKPWNRGEISARGWFPASERKSYYANLAGPGCAGYTAGEKSVLFVSYTEPDLRGNAQNWPPRELPAFLNLVSLAPVPVQYQHFVGP